MGCTGVNGNTTAQMATDRVKMALTARPVTLTLTDKMADAETARTMSVMNAVGKVFMYKQAPCSH